MYTNQIRLYLYPPNEKPNCAISFHKQAEMIDSSGVKMLDYLYMDIWRLDLSGIFQVICIKADTYSAIHPCKMLAYFGNCNYKSIYWLQSQFNIHAVCLLNNIHCSQILSLIICTFLFKMWFLTNSLRCGWT